LNFKPRDGTGLSTKSPRGEKESFNEKTITPKWNLDEGELSDTCLLENIYMYMIKIEDSLKQHY
jgi:hypothetical protein